MKTKMLTALAALVFASIAWVPVTPARAQAAAVAKGEEECPPLAKAQKLGLSQVIAARGEKTCDKDPCEVTIKVSMDGNVCRASVEASVIKVVNNAPADPPKKGQRRGSVSKVTWKLEPTSIGNDKVEFHDQYGVRFLKPKSADEDENDPAQDFHNKQPGKQAFAWDDKHLRKAKLRYCPYVFRVYQKDGKEVREECVGGDPLILNQ